MTSIIARYSKPHGGACSSHAMLLDINPCICKLLHCKSQIAHGEPAHLMILFFRSSSSNAIRRSPAHVTLHPEGSSSLAQRVYFWERKFFSCHVQWVHVISTSAIVPDIFIYYPHPSFVHGLSLHISTCHQNWQLVGLTDRESSQGIHWHRHRHLLIPHLWTRRVAHIGRKKAVTHLHHPEQRTPAHGTSR